MVRPLNLRKIRILQGYSSQSQLYCQYMRSQWTMHSLFWFYAAGRILLRFATKIPPLDIGFGLERYE